MKSESSVSERSPRDQKVHLKTVVPGPRSVALREREDAHIAPGLQGYALMAGSRSITRWAAPITDVDGNTFLDFIGGIGVNALGHGHPEVDRGHPAPGRARARRLVHDRGPRRPRGAPRRARSAPELHRVQLYSGGAEAVESALRLAKSHTRKYEFV